MNKLFQSILIGLLIGTQAFAADTVFQTDRAVLGRHDTNNKDIVFSTNNGATKPIIRAKGDGTGLQFSNDGSNFSSFGSGSGGGSKNYLTQYTASTASGVQNSGNGDFEFGTVGGWSLAHTALSASLFPTSTTTAGTALDSTHGATAASANLALSAISSSSNEYVFTITSGNATVGATYTNNSQTFTVVQTIAAQTVLLATGTGAPLASGTLTKATGTGDATITFSAEVLASSIEKKYSAQLASGAASTAGDMLISSAFYIDAVDQSTPLAISFAMKTLAGSSALNFSGSSSNSYAIYVYDVSAGVWIQPAGVYGMVASGPYQVKNVVFQPQSNTSTRYQLALVNINASSGAFDMLLDAFSVGPQVTVNAPAIGDWTSYTPSVTGTTTNPILGTGAIQTGRWAHAGDSMKVQIDIYAGSSGSTAGSGIYKFSIPSGYTIDTTKIRTISAISMTTGGSVGDGTVLGAASGGVIGGVYSVGNLLVQMASGDTNTVVLTMPFQNTATDLNNSRVAQIGSGTSSTVNFSTASMGYSLRFTVPIVGWSSNTVSSADTDNRVLTARQTRSTTQSINSGVATTVAFNATSYDTGGLVFTNGLFKATVSGKYDVKAMLSFANNTTGVRQIDLVKNGSTLVSTLDRKNAASGTEDTYCQGSDTVDLVSGDTLEIQATQNSGGALNIFSSGSAYDYFIIKRVSGTAVTQATETVSAIYTETAGSGYTSGTAINYATKVKDDHNAVTTGAGVWKFTAPVQGDYNVCGSFYASSLAATAGNIYGLDLYKNGSVAYRLQGVTIQATNTAQFQVSGCTDIQLVTGDYIYLAHGGFSGSPNASGGAQYNYIAIHRVGN